MEQMLQTILNEIKDVKKGQDRLDSHMESLEGHMGNLKSKHHRVFEVVSEQM